MATETANSDSKTVVVGTPPNFWLFNEEDGWDLTRPASSTGPRVYPRIKMETTASAITIAPHKTALVIVDMQNYFLSTALGRKRGGQGHQAEEVLLTHAIPAARKAGIQILWLNWGLTDAGLKTIPPGLWRNFGFSIEERPEPNGERLSLSLAYEKPRERGLGKSLGEVQLEDGTKVDAGKLLMRDQWNAALHGRLHAAFLEGTKAPLPDVMFHKDRVSGFWASTGPLQEFLGKQGIATLLFTGVNTDQCVFGSLQDANYQGFDTVLLNDGCGTTSPEFATQMVEFNCQKSWGFVSTCSELARGVEQMSLSGPE